MDQPSPHQFTSLSDRSPWARIAALSATITVAVAFGTSATGQVVTGVQGTANGTATAPAASRNVLYKLSESPNLWAEGTLGPVEIDRNVGGAAAGDGGLLQIGGHIFRTGFGTRATSAIAFNLNRQCTSFFSWFGIDDSAGPGGSAVFRVIADGQVVFDSGLRTNSAGFARTRWIDVRGVRELVLIAEDGGDGYEQDFANWCDPIVIGAAAPLATDTALRSLRGRFDGLVTWPVEAMHASLLSTGQIVSHASRSALDAGNPSTSAPRDFTRVDLFDPLTNLHTVIDHPTEEIVGAAHARLSDGTLVELGGYGGQLANTAPIGQDQSSAFADGWLPRQPLLAARFGAAALTLGSGRAMVLGGANGTGPSHAPELLADGAASASLLGGIDTAPWLTVGDSAIDRQFPHVHLAPDGRVLLSGWDERVSLLEPTGSGRVSFTGLRESTQRAWGTSTLVRGNEVLMTGGVDHRGNPGAAERSAVRIALGTGAPTVTPAANPLFGRADHDATILADGRLLVIGGSARHATGANEASIQVAEIYDPVAGTWSLAGRSLAPRGFRSTALLLPDGRVWIGGGDPAGPTAETYTPPYLYDPRGSGFLSLRPAWTAAPDRIAYGETFTAQYSGTLPIVRVTMVRLGSSTHGVNSDQRFLQLDFTRNGTTLSVDAPSRGNDAPPGAYMLFGFDEAGIPTIAHTVRIGPPRPTAWEFVLGQSGTAPTPRHETAIAEVAGKLYLIGGRGLKPTQEYDPASGEWRTIGPPPFEIHHFQPIVVDGLVYVVGAFTGNYPNETNVSNIWIFDPADGSWSQGPALPAGRARGGAGAVSYDGRFYLVGGNNQGHNGGARPWFDVFDPQTNAWTQLPDAPRARDHFLAAVVGNRLVVAGGRATTQPNPFTGTIGEVDIFDFTAGSWSTISNDLPTLRAGTMTAAIGRYAVVVGGESNSMVSAHRQVEALDVLTEMWTTLPSLTQGRHSGGVGSIDGRLFVVSGAGNRGGAPELTSTEVIAAGDVLTGAATNSIENAGFESGFAGWQRTGQATLVEGPHGVAAPAARLIGGSVRRDTFGGVTPGEVYRARALYATGGGSGSATLRVEWLGSGGGVIASTQTALQASSQVALATLEAVCPAGAVGGRVRVETTGTREAFVDDVTFAAK